MDLRGKLSLLLATQSSTNSCCLQYHNRLYTLDVQIEHTDETSLLRLGQWVSRRYSHSIQKRAEATKALRECGKSKTLLHEQWKLQVLAQTKPLPRTSLCQ
jgi:hypothetical protein